MTDSIRDAYPTYAERHQPQRPGHPRREGETWDARVLRLARESTQDAYDTADKHYQATSMTAILDAAPPEPPEPVCDTCLNPHSECRCVR